MTGLDSPEYPFAEGRVFPSNNELPLMLHRRSTNMGQSTSLTSSLFLSTRFGPACEPALPSLSGKLWASEKAYSAVFSELLAICLCQELVDDTWIGFLGEWFLW